MHTHASARYIKRRHAVVMVQTTYYMVYAAIFVTPVLLAVKPAAALRRPLWLLRVTGVEGMLVQLAFQVRRRRGARHAYVHVCTTRAHARTCGVAAPR